MIAKLVKTPSTSSFEAAKSWHQNHFLRYFFDGISILLPAGEAFVIAAVSDQASNNRDMQRLVAEESAHQRAHQLYNQELQAQGYPIAVLERGIAEDLAQYQTRLSQQELLCLVAAFEYMTALLAALVIQAKWLAHAAPRQQKLWLWHCQEELAHQSVSMAHLAEIRPPYFLRLSLFWLALFKLSGDVVRHIYVLFHHDHLQQRVTRLQLVMDLSNVMASSVLPIISIIFKACGYCLPLPWLKKIKLN